MARLVVISLPVVCVQSWRLIWVSSAPLLICVGSSGGLEMAALLGVHSVLNAVDVAGEEALRYQR